MALTAEQLSRQPVIVGTGEVSAPDDAWPDLRSPLDLMAEAAGAADADAGGGVLTAVDAVSVIRVFSWDHGNAPRLLCGRLGIEAAGLVYMPTGGNTPQTALNDAARRLVSGEVECVLVAGAEALAAKRAAKKAGQMVAWETDQEHPLPPDTQPDPCHASEMIHRMMLPILVYPLFEPALRAAAGHDLEAHTRSLGRLMAPFTEVASKNPHAWFPTARSADELVTPTSENRMISTPYTKYLNSVLEVNQGAALILTTAARARELGIPEEQWVWFWGGADCNDIWYVTERTSYDSSPGMEACYTAALEASGVGVDDISAFDLYSCFPSAVQLGMRALGLPENETRPLTVTGGLPYFGGPGNNYVSHSVAEMAQHLRETDDGIGFVSGNGWFVTKHSAGVYGARPPKVPFRPVEHAVLQGRVDALDHPRIEPQPEGTGVLDAYSVSYSKAGEPEAALAIVKLAAGRRAVAMSNEADVMRRLTVEECYGMQVDVRAGGNGANVFDF